jgi:hypothetical protein
MSAPRRTFAEIVAAYSPDSFARPDSDFLKSLDEQRRKGYWRNLRAVSALFKDKSDDQIGQVAEGMTRGQARKILYRVIKPNRYGEPTGFWACVPGRRDHRKHVRKAPFDPELVKKGLGLSGALTHLFQCHPEIELGLKQFIVTRRVLGSEKFSRVELQDVIDAFHVLCKRAGISQDQWPFVHKFKGAGAIQKWLKKQQTAYPVHTASNQFGDNAAAKVKVDVKDILEAPARFKRKAYHEIQIDEHKWDGLFVVQFPNREGTFTYVETTRVWVLVAVECRAKPVLAIYVSYRQQYDKKDVLTLIRRIFNPPARSELSLRSPEYGYDDGAAFPSELPEFKGNTFQVLNWDSDASHEAITEKSQIEEVIGCTFEHRGVGMSMTRAIAEQFMKVLARPMQRTSVSTGNSPADPLKRDDLMQTAERLLIPAWFAQEFADILGRNYNVTPQAKLGGIGPLQHLRELALVDEVFTSKLGDLGPNRLYRLLPCYEVNITRTRGNYGPFSVCFLGTRYSSQELATDEQLLTTSDWSAKLYVEEDARFAHVVPNAFPERVFHVVCGRNYRHFSHPLEYRRLFEAMGSEAARGGRALRKHPVIGVLESLGHRALAGMPTAAAALNLLSNKLEDVARGATTSEIPPERLEQLMTDLDADVEKETPEPEEGTRLLEWPRPDAPVSKEGKPDAVGSGEDRGAGQSLAQSSDAEDEDSSKTSWQRPSSDDNDHKLDNLDDNPFGDL